MIGFLRIFFWPVLWLLVWVAGYAGLGVDLLKVAAGWWAGDPLENTLIILTAYMLWRWAKYNMRFMYAWWMGKHLVSMKVLLPRTESKIDQEKRTEKDFKEKVAIMEQLYRALWEVKSLTFWQHMHFWIFRYATISFELYVERGELTFYVLTQPGLVSIVEKQITAFYPDAEVTMQQTPVMKRKGFKLVGYNMTTKKKYFFPIRFYDEMQDDPLNDVSNVLSKLEEDEMAAVQVIIQPVFSDRWARKTRNYASLKFKGKEDRWVARIPILTTFINVMGGVATGTEGSTFAPGAERGDSFVRMIQPEEELYKRMGQKAGMSGFHCSIRILASAKTWARRKPCS